MWFQRRLLHLFLTTTFILTASAPSLGALETKPPEDRPPSRTSHRNSNGNSQRISQHSVGSRPLTLISQYYTLDDSNVQGDQISLLGFTKHMGPMPNPTERYNRRLQFGSWQKDPTDSTCLNARGKVLSRDSKVPVVLRNSHYNCAVSEGLWQDPYSGQTFKQAADVDIDHVVPLKNAYESGAWEWSAEKRCNYFNFQKTTYHLLAVSAFENTSKGDDSPATYMPPNRAFQCEYLKDWLAIKMAWQLRLSNDETEAIQRYTDQNGCRTADMVMKKTELDRIRQAIHEGTEMCRNAVTPAAELTPRAEDEAANNAENEIPPVLLPPEAVPDNGGL